MTAGLRVIEESNGTRRPPGDAPVNHGDTALGVGFPDIVARALDDIAQALLIVADSGFGGAHGRHILGDTEQAAPAADLIFQPAPAVLDIPEAAIGKLHPYLDPADRRRG